VTLDRSGRPSVGIVGAGVSGLVAARTLADRGVGITVFEKARGPGGRLSTRRTGELAFDHGAQYFTVRGEPFRRTVSSWGESGLVARWDGRIGVAVGGKVEPKEAGPERFVGVPRMSSIARHLADSLDVRYGTRVERLEPAGAGWRLVAADGKDLGRFDVVIVTAPPAQSAALLAPVPDLAAAVAAVRMLPAQAVMAAFDTRLDLPYDGLFFPEDAPLSWAARNSSKPGRPPTEAWVLHGSPGWSARNLETSREAVAETLLTSLVDATGAALPAPSFVTTHRWLYALAEEPLDAGCLFDAERRIGVAGDWCRRSRVEGAFLSGDALAGRVFGLLNDFSG
jgi:predicted NAD/FAD-dependent oxidoreductase